MHVRQEIQGAQGQSHAFLHSLFRSYHVAETLRTKQAREDASTQCICTRALEDCQAYRWAVRVARCPSMASGMGYLWVETYCYIDPRPRVESRDPYFPPPDAVLWWYSYELLRKGGELIGLTPPFRSKPEWRLFFFRSRGVESNIFRRSRANAYVQKYVTMRVCLVQIRRDAMPTVRNVKAKFLQPFDLRGDGPFPATLYRREETREGGNPLTELNVVASVETCGWYAEIRGRGSRTSRKL